MPAVTRLLTSVDLAEDDDDGPDAPRMSVAARLEAVLADGRRAVLLDDRGGSGQLGGSSDHEPSAEDRRRAGGRAPGGGAGEPPEGPGIGAFETREEREREARDVVGPDEPFGRQTQAD